jgi:hypothetical protein
LASSTAFGYWFTLSFAAIYLALGCVIGGLTGCGVAVALRSRFDVEHFLRSCGLGIGISALVFVFAGLTAGGTVRLNGLLAGVLGADLSLFTVFLCLGPVLSAAANIFMISRLPRRDRVNA